MKNVYNIYRTHWGRESVIAYDLTEEEAHEMLMAILDNMPNVKYFDEKYIKSIDEDTSFFEQDGYYAKCYGKWEYIYQPFIDNEISDGLPNNDKYIITPIDPTRKFSLYKIIRNKESIIKQNLTENEAHKLIMAILEKNSELRFIKETDMKHHNGNRTFFCGDGYYKDLENYPRLVYRPFIDRITFEFNSESYRIDTKKATTSQSIELSAEKLLVDGLRKKGVQDRDIKFMLNEIEEDHHPKNKDLKDILLGFVIIVTILIIIWKIIGFWWALLVSFIVLFRPFTKRN